MMMMMIMMMMTFGVLEAVGWKGPLAHENENHISGLAWHAWVAWIAWVACRFYCRGFPV